MAQTPSEDLPLRIGRSVGRTLYVQAGSEPSDDDAVIGLVDSPVLAERIVRATTLADRLPAVGIEPFVDHPGAPSVESYVVMGEANVAGYADAPASVWIDDHEVPIGQAERNALGVLAVLAAMRADGLGQPDGGRA